MNNRCIYNPNHYRFARSMREVTQSDFHPLDKPHKGDRAVFIVAVLIAAILFFGVV